MNKAKSIIDRAIDTVELPFHLYYPQRVEEAVKEFKRIAKKHYPRTEVLFAFKSNPCNGAIKVVKNLDIGVDVVSEYELAAALGNDINPDHIVCNGNAKTEEYLELAISTGSIVAADSLEEVRLISEIAGREKIPVRVMIRLSGMDLEGLTSSDQSTAAHWTKFGIPFHNWREFYQLARSDPYILPVGISAHIGTQICDARGYERLLIALLEVIETSNREGWTMTRIDIGGGFPLSYLDEDQWSDFQTRLKKQRTGVPTSDWVTWGEFGMGGYDDEWVGKAYWSAHPGPKMLEHLLTYKPDGKVSVAKRLKEAGHPTLCIEPGRGLFGEAGITLAEVMGVKEVEGNKLVILNLGIVNHGTVLVTPDIYPMLVYPLKEDDQAVEVFVAGRLCFTGDMISKVKIPLNRLPERGDIIVIGMTGAYCADHFASNSCGFPRPPKIAVMPDGTLEFWRLPETVEDVFY